MLKNVSKTILIIGIVIILLILHYINLLQWIERPIVNFLTPVQKTFYNLGSSSYSFFYNYTQCNNLGSENEDLQSLLITKDVDQMELAELRRENEYLRSELDFVKREQEDVLVTQIISKPLLQNDLFIINRGSDDGIKVGQPVLAEQGVLVGKIFAVEKHQASVALLSNSSSTVAVTLNNNTHTQGVVQGSMGLGLLMDLIPPEEAINMDDLVFTSGLEDMIGQNYLIGKIANILSGDTELYQKAEVVPSIDYRQLRILTVVLSQ
ncbi:MAG: rod shape-determining protein MreC [Candidatus Komeilibacteria bacterium]